MQSENQLQHAGSVTQGVLLAHVPEVTPPIHDFRHGPPLRSRDYNQGNSSARQERFGSSDATPCRRRCAEIAAVR